jgi:peptide chain release factor 1
VFEKLEAVAARYERLTEQLGTPELSAQPARLREVAKEQSDLEPLVQTYRQYRKVLQEKADAQALLADDDADMRAIARDELSRLDGEETDLIQQLRKLLLPRDPNDDRNVVLEIRAGTGGEEAALFAASLFRMYTRYAERQRYKIELLSTSYSEVGGFKEVIALVEGKGAYSRLKFESGVHRVQRVPETENQGRIHTSAVTVAILAEAEDVDVQLDERDLQIDVYRSSGPGGQSVNTTDSAVRVTHIPTGMVVTCQDEKSQHKNKAKAIKVLKSRLLEREQARAAAEVAATRKDMVGTGDRSERIRTYNFPQGRITDHRIGLTLYSLDSFIEGDMDEVLSSLQAHFEAEQLKAQGDL